MRTTLMMALVGLFVLTGGVSAQDKAGPLPSHEKWTNSLKPRGVCGPQLTLASGGKALYTILLPAAPTGQDTKAAEDLAKYLKQMTGAPFGVVEERAADERPKKVISIGRTEALSKADIPESSADLSKDGYAIAVKGEDLFLLGGSRRGAISAVYALLEEDLGCRWYDSSSENAVVPDVEELRFQPVPRTYVPQFEELRWILVWEALNSVNFSLWNRSMDIGLAHKFPCEWGGIDNISGIHSLPGMIPPDKYFEEHPEYFSMIDGKRNPVQICPSNPDVVELLTQLSKDMVSHYADDPVPAHECPGHKYNNDYNNVALTPRDGPEYCQCPDCQALIDREGTPGAPLLLLVNKVAEAVAKTHPEKRIWFLAYQSTAKPPKTIRPRDNVIIWLCGDSHSFGPATVYVTETPIFQKYLSGWQDLDSKIVIWEYVTNFGTDMHLSPLPNLSVVGEDIRFFAKHKSVVGMLLQGDLWTRGDRGRMRSWVYAKQTWDPSRDTADLIRDFVYGYYGKAAEPVLEYNRLLHLVWDKWHKSPVLLAQKWGAAPPMTDEFMARASVLFDEAEKLAADDPVLASRVEDARLPVLFQQLLNGLGRAEDSRNPMAADDPYWKIVGRLRDYCNRWGLSRLDGRYDALVRAEDAEKGEYDKSFSQVLDTGYGRIHLQTLPATWLFATDAEKVGMAEEWFAGEYDDKDWGPIRTDLGAGWAAQGFIGASSDAFGWYRQNADVLSSTLNPSRPYRWYLYFEAVDEDAYVYINGRKAFEHSCDSTGLKPQVIWETPFMFEATKFINAGQKNLFAVCVYNRIMMAGVYKPVHLIASERELSLEAIRDILEQQNE